MTKYTEGTQFGAHIDGQPIKSIEGLIMVLRGLPDCPVNLESAYRGGLELVDDGVFIGSVESKLARKGGQWKHCPATQTLTISVDLP